jgi:hypothetical protein
VRTPRRLGTTIATGAVVLALAACGAGSSSAGSTVEKPRPTSAASTRPSATPTTPAPEPEVAAAGTQQDPLGVGESAPISTQSAFTVRLDGTDPDAAAAITAAKPGLPGPQPGEAFIVGTFTITVSGERLAAQGIDIATDGADPGLSVILEYLGADGVVYTALSGTGCVSEDEMWMSGPVFEDGGSVTAATCLSVPAEQVPGGLWIASNTANESIYFTGA